MTLRSLRERAGLSQEELAERSGLTPHAISALERGVRRRPYPHTVRSLADGLGLDATDRAALVAAVPSRSGRGTGAETPGPSALDREPTEPTSMHDAPDAPRPRALPVPLTSLVGREPAVAEVTALLTSGTRLVTLTGLGGVGKTRLALAAAEEVRGHFADDVAWVPLAALTEPDLVVPAVGRAVGLSHIEVGDADEVVANALRDRTALLVLDNLEQLLPASGALARLLQACPRLVVLATSRAPLRIRGEHEHLVRPLTLPTGGETAGLEDVAGSAAADLFMSRARDVRPGLTLTTGNAQAVAHLCTRLAGIPLALELAAAKTRVLEPAELVHRLEDALSRGAASDLPERQQTMTATLDWSYDLLAAEEQTLLRQLATFVDGFGLAAAEAVADGPRPRRAGTPRRALPRALPAAPGRHRALPPARAGAAVRPRQAGRGRVPRDGAAPRAPLPGAGRGRRAGIPA